MDGILRKMQGTWLIESAIEAGKPVEQGAARLSITGDRFERHTATHVFRRRIHLGEAAQTGDGSPPGAGLAAWIDLEITNEPGLGAVLAGLVEVAGDRMSICHAQPGKPRPTAFSSTAENKNVLSISRRAR